MVAAAGTGETVVGFTAEEEREFDAGEKTVVRETVVNEQGDANLGLGVAELLQVPVQADLGTGEHIKTKPVIFGQLARRESIGIEICATWLLLGCEHIHVELGTRKKIQMTELSAKQQRRLQIDAGARVGLLVKTLLRSVGISTCLQNKMVEIQFVADAQASACANLSACLLVRGKHERRAAFIP